MHVLHISFKESNRNNLFNYMLETRNVCVTEYNFFDPRDYEALLNDSYEYDALVLGSQGGRASRDGWSRKGLSGFKYLNLYNSKDLNERKLKLSRIVQKYANIPILGICYGSQVLNMLYGGSVSPKRDIKKAGYLAVRVDTNDPLFKGLPPDIHAEFNTWYPSVPPPSSSVIAVTEEDNVMAAQSFPNNHYALYFHIVHGDASLQRIVENFINIAEREKNYRVVMKVSVLGLLFGLYVMLK